MKRLKKKGILNREIAHTLARLGHTDTIVIADCGLPIPNHVPCIDLSLFLGTPSFTSVLQAVTDDMEIENMTLANEMSSDNHPLIEWLDANYEDVAKTFISHEQLKNQVKDAKAVIRTGEATPYANVILQSGVIF